MSSAEPSRRRALVIDDEDLVRVATGRLLGRLGYQVSMAENGAVGVSVFSEHAGAFDLVLLDMAMPVMGGAECFEQLRGRAPEVPVVVCSGFARTSETQAILTHARVEFLEKPYRLEDLRRAIARVSAA